MDKKLEILSPRNLIIRGVLSVPENENPPLVIINHGFLSFKENKLLVYIAKECVKAGFAAFRFDFTGCAGKSEGGPNDIRTTYYINDLKAVIEELKKQPIDNNRIALVGHSLGGFIAINVARKVKVQSIVSIAAPANDRVQNLTPPSVAKIWKETDNRHFTAESGCEINLPYVVHEELLTYDAVQILKDMDTPIRFIHGDKDVVIPVKSSEDMFNATSAEKNLEIIKGGDHLLLAKPFPEIVAKCTVEWLKKTL